jgi:hypothetical protein
MNGAALEQNRALIADLNGWALQLRPEQLEEARVQAAFRAIDDALLATIEHIKALEEEREPATKGREIAALWQEASRSVGKADPELAKACFMKGMGWVKPSAWEQARKDGLKIGIEEMQEARMRLIEAGQPVEAQSQTQGAQNWWDWLQDTNQREALKLIGAAVVAVIGGLWVAFGFFDGKEFVASFFRKEATFNFCQGEKSERCSQPWIPCEQNPTGWAVTNHPDVCVHVEVLEISKSPGNKCGYGTFQIRCTTSKREK